MVLEIAIALGILIGLGLLFGTIIAIAYKKLRVKEDPRIDIVEDMLPGTNCGACSVPGCRAFSEKIVSGELTPGKCTVSSPSGIEEIANYLGVDVGMEEKRVARLLCAGGIKEAQNLAEYRGTMKTCRGEAVVSDGPKDCSWGCLGLGDCEEVCDFDAIEMNENGLPVVIPELCTACNDCIEICPKDLFTIMPISQKLIVQCKSLIEGDAAEEKCSVACTACGLCEADAGPGLISMIDNLAVINYDLNHLATHQAIRRCPTNAIVWLEGQQFEDQKKSTLPIGRVELNPKYTYWQ